MSRERNNWQKTGVKHYKLHADNSGSHADIIMTSNGSTLTKCPSKNAGLLLSEIFKDPSIVTYKGILVRAKFFKRLLHVDPIVITRAPLVIQHCNYISTGVPEN